MAVKLKKLEEQVVVITGATSGIGLATARQAAERGAKLVLAARDGDALDTLAHEMRQRGAEVATVAADVGDPADVTRIGKAAVEKFGRVDTWINNAGVGIFGTLEQVTLEDMQRLFQTNFWGVVHGSLEAVKLLRAHGGGAIINLGSEVSDSSVPLQGTYAASKHAIKAFTESLRMELEKDKVPISMTLIKPAAIDTPFPKHAKNYMQQEPALPLPIYSPELAARTILHAAEVPERDLFVGGGAKFMSVLSQLLPRSMDRLMRGGAYEQQQSSKPSAPNRRDALHSPDARQELRQRAGLTPKPIDKNLYTTLGMHSTATKTVLVGGALLAAYALWRKPKLGAWHA